MAPRPLPVASRWPLSRQLFTILVLFGLIPLFVSNTWGYWKTREHTLESARQYVADLAAVQAAEASAWMANQSLLLASMLAGDDTLLELTEAAADCDDSLGCHDIHQALSTHLGDRLSSSRELLRLEVLTPSGRVLAASGTDSSASYNIACVGRDGSPDNPPLLSYDASGEPFMMISTPVRDHQGRRLGWLCGTFNFAVHARLVTVTAGRASETTSYLVNGEGRILCSSIEHNHGAQLGHTAAAFQATMTTPEAEERKGTSEHVHEPAVSESSAADGTGESPPAHDQPTQAQLAEMAHHRANWPTNGSAQPWEEEYSLPSGVRLYAAFAPINTLTWGMVVEMPAHVALEELEALKWQAMMFLVATAVLLLIVARLASQKLARPLAELVVATESASSGGLGVQLPLRGPEELTDLTRSFNRMSLALHAAQEGLELRIMERTQDLEHSRTLLQRIIDTIAQRVIMVDRTGRIMSTNRVASRSYPGELVGKDFFSATHAIETEKSPHPLRKTLAHGVASSGDVSEAFGDQREIAHVDTYPVHGRGDDSSTELEGAVIVSRIVSIERQMQAQLMHQEKMASFGLLAAGIAHDIANPLSSIQSQLRLAREFPSADRTDETLAVVESEVSRISRLLHNIVSFARRHPDEAGLLDLRSVIDDVVRLIEHDPRSSSIRITVDVPVDTPSVVIKRDDVVQILLNLGVNALQCMKEGGELSFSVVAADVCLCVHVRDTGPGIRDDARNHLFDPFFTTKPPGEGTGLGLFVSRGIAESFGGDLILQHTSNSGTVFELQIPIADDDLPGMHPDNTHGETHDAGT